jgi:hypothetical protein
MGTHEAQHSTQKGIHYEDDPYIIIPHDSSGKYTRL